MRKLSLKVDELQVESFRTDSIPGGRGTVEGHYGTYNPKKSDGYSCDGTTGCGTCAPELSCAESCALCVTYEETC
jgi:hypothetical protein